MLSGATLLDYRNRYSTKTFFKKRFEKTVIPFIFWSIVSIFWSVYISHYLDSTVFDHVSNFLDAIINTKGMSIYWFFLPLFSLYLSIPFLSKIPINERNHIFQYGIILSFILTSVLPVLLPLMGISFNFAMDFPLNGGGYVIYLLLGYVITHDQSLFSSKAKRHIIYLLGFAGLILRYVATLLKSYQINDIDRTFWGYQRFPCVLLSVAVFVWFWYHDWSYFANGLPKKIIRVLSSASFGIYLTHFYILRFWVSHFNIEMTSWKWRVFGIPLVYGISLIVTLLIGKIPYMQKIVPCSNEKSKENPPTVRN